ncbi:ribosome small subunit-dependent GTPase A [Cochlodiniinecator piscidefendens]|uniref:ribosome small subunit-dependent GTPase A n=1 Tax=Cochlodiniinecator piscidefendens TaxID=2715756 RepID=UPI00140A5CAA|nr:ribosome small subunit-dependent GTPase A [Cochlodiniinecator piscidefendens]
MTGNETDHQTSESDQVQLNDLGWQDFFEDQMSKKELEQTQPVRVMEVHRNGMRVLGKSLSGSYRNLHSQDGDSHKLAVVGDWVLMGGDDMLPLRVLKRKSLFKRRAPGKGHAQQLIASNVETAFIVSSCNQDFNVARLERYLAMVHEAGSTPVIILTKADLTDDIETFQAQAQSMAPKLSVLVLNAKGSDVRELLSPWCQAGQTIAFLGSSGVGKSTLVNAVSGTQKAETQDIREDDAKGRHTTTRREIYQIDSGCLVLDTPGMRELQLTEAAFGVSEVFADISILAADCKFNDCKHDKEPGCAIQSALEAGEIDPVRFERWKKLLAEEHHNTALLTLSPGQIRAQNKAIRKIQKANRK